MNFWDSLDPTYRLILCDVWGVVHDGVNLYPGAADRLQQWRQPVSEREFNVVFNEFEELVLRRVPDVTA